MKSNFNKLSILLLLLCSMNIACNNNEDSKEPVIYEDAAGKYTIENVCLEYEQTTKNKNQTTNNETSIDSVLNKDKNAKCLKYLEIKSYITEGEPVILVKTKTNPPTNPPKSINPYAER